MNRLLLALVLIAPCALAQDPRAIMQEVQKRQHSESQHYEGTLEVIGGGNRIATKDRKSTRLNSSHT